jgi:fructose-1,6-bisphosphatase II
MQAKIWPRDEAERKSLEAAGWGNRLDKTFRSLDLARGDEILFAATGICDSPFLKGVEVRGSTAVTHSILMRAKSGTLRYLTTAHNLQKKTIHLHSVDSEQKV